MDVHRIGFTQLSDNNNAKINIIFIHGLRGHPRYTWESGRKVSNTDINSASAASNKSKSRKSLKSFDSFKSLFRSKSYKPSGSSTTSQSLSDIRKVFWLQDYLVEDIHEARVWTYGYNADMIDGLFQANNQNSVLQHSRDLVEKIKGEIENEDSFVFVAHSLGGIIVKDAIHSSQPVHRRTKSVIFLGTPHRGSIYAGWGEIASNLARLALRDSDKEILEPLKVNSELLDNIHKGFKTIVCEYGIKIHSFQEAQATSGIKGLHVNDFSSKLDLPQTLETVESINANHMEMARCSNRAESQYRAILGVLRQVIRNLNKRRIEETKGGLLDNVYNWIFDNSDFQQWHFNRDNRLLWIKGDPGKGKTMLLCALSDILKDILHDKNLKPTILIIDALDECQKDLPQLLRLIVSGLSISSRVKWLVSSRNWPEIEEQLQQAEQGTRLSLELNAESVSAAVRWYIREKVKYLARTKKYTTETKDTIERYLLEHANGTFLWVALVCQNLEKARLFTNSKLQDYPSELDPLYNRMMEQIVDMEDIEAAKICLQILAIVVIAYRPLALDELMSLMEMNNEIPLEEIIQLCGSFLVANKGSELYTLIHDAKRFVLYNRIGIEQAPLQIYCSALFFAPENSIIRKTFQEYIPSWIYKISRTRSNWSAALQTLEGHSGSVKSVAFSPDGTKVASGSHDNTIRLWDAMTGESLQTLEGHSDWVKSVAFSPDGTKVASGSDDETIRLWDAMTGESLQTLEGHSDSVSSVAFSPDGTKVASGSDDETIRLWDAMTGESLQTLEGHSGSVSSVAFSPDGTKVASGSHDKTIRLWDAMTGESLQTLEGHSGSVSSVAFSPDGTKVASGSHDKTIRLWDAMTGESLQTLEGHSGSVSSVAFSPDGTKVASGSHDKTIRLWDAMTGESLQTLEGHSSWVNSVAFSPDGTKVASGSHDKTIRLWDAMTGESLQTLEGHSSLQASSAFER
ncbi:hypothetical protein SS1G_02421 [Sclerotinia sclerotiorum 1980 UF-70]|uniref:Mitochondrial division protein 1 n=1 Tax=Sclerotinia sclerotiorum (strain ATCC 18683 / 1980 / Ss-1) TaxID=665079 RepID=A7EAT8_SCLS1|nr:hypothetical protein SS1G_02421 [Sclerotinia sclerotiorum 1980 UF-70]EDN99566.1 hypothetical protein SS1G_02421 [Sclerotinia sclerotiorum 1980 UF-70]